MIAAVTGASGFIGRELVRSLVERGHSVRVLSRGSKPYLFSESISVYRGDLTDTDIRPLTAFADGADVVFHAAGQLTDEASMRRIHVGGTEHLLRAASGKIGRWVQLSSVGVYGSVLNGVIDEETQPNPKGTYECTKAESDILVQAHAAAEAFDVAVLRPSNVFGKDMTNPSFFQWIGVIDRGLFTFIGKPGASANYITVENVVDALILCGTMPQAAGRVYNLSDHRSLESFVGSIAGFLDKSRPRLRLPESLARTIAKACRRFPAMPLTESRVDALVNRSIYSTNRIEQELNYSHRISMENAIFKMVEAWPSRVGRLTVPK